MYYFVSHKTVLKYCKFPFVVANDAMMKDLRKILQQFVHSCINLSMLRVTSPLGGCMDFEGGPLLEGGLYNLIAMAASKTNGKIAHKHGFLFPVVSFLH